MKRGLVFAALFGIILFSCFSSAVVSHTAEQIRAGIFGLNFTGNWSFVNGSVGIGTTSPGKKLSVTNGDSAVVNIYSNGGSVGVLDAVDPVTPTTGRWLSINPTGGNVGIGTTSPSEKLEVNGAIQGYSIVRGKATGSDNAYIEALATGTGIAGFYFDASDGDLGGGDYGSLVQNNDLSVELNNYGNNPLYFKTNTATRMTILGNGNVGIGTTSPTQKLDVAGNIEASVYYDRDNTGYYVNPAGNSVMSQINSGTPITSVNIGSQSVNYATTANYANSAGSSGPASQLSTTISGHAIQSNYITNWGFVLEDIGSWKVGTRYAETIETFSDRTLKTNIKPLTYGLNETLALKPVSYSYNGKDVVAVFGNNTRLGLIAQDVKPIMPELVTGGENGSYYLLSYDQFIPVLIKSVQEQQTQINDLKSENEMLKTELCEQNSSFSWC